MAPKQRPSREQQLKTIEGLGYLANGTMGSTAQFAALPDDSINMLVRTLGSSVDCNAAQPRGAMATLGALVSGTKPQGAKDKLFTLLDRAESAEGLSDPSDVKALHSALGASGYKIKFDETLDEEERGYFTDFRARLKSGLSLSAIANQNFANADEQAARLEREAAQKREEDLRRSRQLAQEQATQVTTYNKYSASLVYAGYLDPAKVNDTNAAALAMNNFIVNNTAPEDLAAEQTRIFKDMTAWQPTDYAVEYLNRETAGQHISTRLANDLESGDPDRTRLAQNYMAAQGRDVRQTAVTDEATVRNGQEIVRQPLAMPPGLVTGGQVDINMLYTMAGKGQLYLPEDKLSAEERAIAQTLPASSDRKAEDVFSRETFIAARLILDNPQRYEQILAEENTRRAALTLNAPVVLPVVAVPAAATEMEERIDIAQNPAGLKDQGPAFLDAAKPITDHIRENGTGVTDRAGYVVFNGQDVAVSGIVDALQKNKGAYGNGVEDNKMTLTNAVNLVRSAVSVDNMASLGTMTSDSDITAVMHTLGYTDPNHQFDLTNPVELSALVKGVVSHQDLQAAMTRGGGNATSLEQMIEENSSLKKPGVSEAIDRATGVTRPAQPENRDVPVAENENAKGGRVLTSRFGAAAAGPVETADAELIEAMRRRYTAAAPAPAPGV